MKTTPRIHEIATPRNLAVNEMKCLHAVSGAAPEHKVCSNGYECGNCPYDQMLEDMAVAGVVFQPAQRRDARAA